MFLGLGIPHRIGAAGDVCGNHTTRVQFMSCIHLQSLHSGIGEANNEGEAGVGRPSRTTSSMKIYGAANRCHRRPASKSQRGVMVDASSRAPADNPDYWVWLV